MAMGVLESLHQALVDTTNSREESQETFEYRCVPCGNTFTEPKTRMTRVTCPECGSADLQLGE